MNKLSRDMSSGLPCSAVTNQDPNGEAPSNCWSVQPCCVPLWTPGIWTGFRNESRVVCFRMYKSSHPGTIYLPLKRIQKVQFLHKVSQNFGKAKIQTAKVSAKWWYQGFQTCLWLFVTFFHIHISCVQPEVVCFTCMMRQRPGPLWARSMYSQQFF